MARAKPDRSTSTLIVWGSSNFSFSPPRRSWPHEPTRLEVLATRANMSDEELRSLLTREIERRRTPGPGA